MEPESAVELFLFNVLRGTRRKHTPGPQEPTGTHRNPQVLLFCRSEVCLRLSLVFVSFVYIWIFFFCHFVSFASWFDDDASSVGFVLQLFELLCLFVVVVFNVLVILKLFWSVL